MAFSANEFVSGTVTHVTDYGAFVKLPGGDIGMVHISKLSKSFVRDIRSFIRVGDNVEVKVLSNQNGKLALTMIKDEPKRDLESMLKHYLSASEENIKILAKSSKNRSGRR